MSHDFPDGPDYNPEVIEDDPWDDPILYMSVCSKCGRPTDECIRDLDGHYWRDHPSASTGADFPPEAA